MDADRTRASWTASCRRPVAYLVCNFAQGVNGRPATLTHDDVTTLFHEFGHCLHHLLTDQTEVAVSGISGVEWDAVELPSQFMENFAWEWDVVKGLAKHVETGESIPESLFEKMLAAKNFSPHGMRATVEFALFDMLLHTSFNPDTDDVQDLLQDVRRKVAVSFPPNYNRFPQSFSHIFAGGYAAGYYSYKWAEVLSADAFSAFEETGVLNPETGARFRREIPRTRLQPRCDGKLHRLPRPPSGNRRPAAPQRHDRQLTDAETAPSSKRRRGRRFFPSSSRKGAPCPTSR